MIDDAESPGLARPNRFTTFWGYLLALGYLLLAIWAAPRQPWPPSGELWPPGPFGMPNQIPEVAGFALIIMWSTYALSWPVRMVRPTAWGIVGLYQPIALLLTGWWWLAIGLTAIHLLAFDPRWLPSAKRLEPDLLFYDGHCGLCHRWVKRVIRADREGTLFSFAPLQGRTAEGVLTPAQRGSLPDSVVVRSAGGQLRVKSDAVIYILRSLGGWYRLGGMVLSVVPAPLRDIGYDAIARVRHHLFAKPADACPIVPEEQRMRFKP